MSTVAELARATEEVLSAQRELAALVRRHRAERQAAERRLRRAKRAWLSWRADRTEGGRK